MAPFSMERPDAAQPWFLANTDTDFVRATEQSGAEPWYCLTGRNHDHYACNGWPIHTLPDRNAPEKVCSITAEVLP